MNATAGPSSRDDEESRDSLGEGEELIVDSALCKRAQEVKGKREDDTYSWLVRTLEVSFEYFNGEELEKVVNELTEMTKKFCYQDLEANENKLLLEKFYQSHPIKNTPEDFNYKAEFEKFKKSSCKLSDKQVENHQKYKRFLSRIKDLEKAKQQSQTDAVAVD